MTCGDFEMKIFSAPAKEFSPRTLSACVDPSSGILCLSLTNATTLTIPIHLIQGLADAHPDDLADIQVSPSGEGLHVDTLDVDLSVPGLVAGVFGAKAWMKGLGGTT